ncbi:MAG TPA: hypothetical protein VLT57_10375, partial [Bryobacteraceae bacterium]|nr:hypothetical protein [Bryobacteraceae bacterium]
MNHLLAHVSVHHRGVRSLLGLSASHFRDPFCDVFFVNCGRGPHLRNAIQDLTPVMVSSRSTISMDSDLKYARNSFRSFIHG